MVVLVKNFDYYHHKFNFGDFFQLSCKVMFEMLYTILALLTMTLFFQGCSWIGEKAPLPKKYLTYPTVMTLGIVTPYPKKIQNINKLSETLLLFWWHQHFFSKNQLILLYQEIQIQIQFEQIISNYFNFFEPLKFFIINMAEILIMSAKFANSRSS